MKGRSGAAHGGASSVEAPFNSTGVTSYHTSAPSSAGWIIGVDFDVSRVWPVADEFRVASNSVVMVISY
jgi:hypothetical protein